jgi:hypothetical protein
MERKLGISTLTFNEEDFGQTVLNWQVSSFFRSPRHRSNNGSNNYFVNKQSTADLPPKLIFHRKSSQLKFVRLTSYASAFLKSQSNIVENREFNSLFTLHSTYFHVEEIIASEMIKFRVKEEPQLVRDEDLIKKVKGNEFLFNPKNPDYRNLPQRALVWASIAKEMGVMDRK